MLDFKDWNTYFGLIGVVSLLFSIWVYFRSKLETKVTLYVQDLIPIISDSLSIFKNLQVKVIDNDIQVKADVYHLRFFLKNTGSVDISSAKVFDQIKISLPSEIQILDYKIQDYPSNINQQTIFNSFNNDFSTGFVLLRKGELIQYDIILHVPESLKKEKKIKHFFHIENFVTGNVFINGRIENCKQIAYSRIRKEPPGKTYITTAITLFGGLIFIILMFILMTKPFRVVENKIRPIKYHDTLLMGRIDFINNDSLVITEHTINKDRNFIISRTELDKDVYIYPYKKRRIFLRDVLIMLGGLFLLFSAVNYIELRKARNKKSISDFIKNIES